MAENGTRLNVAIPMPSGKRTIFIIGVLLMSASFTAAGYSGGVVLPTRLAEIGSMDYYAIISSMSTLGMMLVLPLVGKIADIFGCKAVAIFGIVLQLCARIAMIFIADTIVFMVVYAASSIGGGMFVTAPYVMIATVVNAEERPRFYGLIATFNALGALVFPLVAGAVVDAGFTTLGFVVYAPLCILGGAAILSLYPNLKGRPNSAKFDLLGIILLVISICCIVVWLSLGGKAFAFTSSIGLALLIVGIVAVALLIRVELKSENPSIPIRMFAKKRFTSAFLCQTLLACYSTCSAGWVIVYVQQMMQGSSTMSSTVTMPQTIVIAILGVVLGGYLGKILCKAVPPNGRTLHGLCDRSRSDLLLPDTNFSYDPDMGRNRSRRRGFRHRSDRIHSFLSE